MTDLFFTDLVVNKDIKSKTNFLGKSASSDYETF